MSTQLILVCNGRRYGNNGQPLGEPCGLTYPQLTDSVWTGRSMTLDQVKSGARAAGWRIGPQRPNRTDRDAMCPGCAKPDTRTAAACRDLERSTRR